MSIKRFPFAGIGVLLIALSVTPTAVAFVRAINQFPSGDGDAASEASVALAFHPAMIAFANIGLLLVVIGIVRSCSYKVGSFRLRHAVDQTVRDIVIQRNVDNSRNTCGSLP